MSNPNPNHMFEIIHSLLNNNKKASKYCARLRPLKLVYKSLAYENKSDASKEEYRIKQLSHRDKLNLIYKN